MPQALFAAQAASIEAGLGSNGVPSTSAPSHHHRGTLFSTSGAGISVRVRGRRHAIPPVLGMYEHSSRWVASIACAGLQLLVDRGSTLQLRLRKGG